MPPSTHSLPPGYRIEPLQETDAVSGRRDRSWRASVPYPTRGRPARRVHEVLMVALDPDDRVAGVSTAFLQRSAQLGLDLWNCVSFVLS